MNNAKDKFVLINASNLHNGGGVQVAISFLYEITLLELDLLKLENITKNLGYEVTIYYDTIIIK